MTSWFKVIDQLAWLRYRNIDRSTRMKQRFSVGDKVRWKSGADTGARFIIEKIHKRAIIHSINTNSQYVAYLENIKHVEPDNDKRRFSVGDKVRWNWDGATARFIIDELREEAVMRDVNTGSRSVVAHGHLLLMEKHEGE